VNPVAKASDLGDDCAMRVEVGGTAICLARSKGRFFAVRDECTHEDVALSEGEVHDGYIECYLHGSRFDLSTGEACDLPATDPLETFSVVVEGDEVFIALADAMTPNTRQ
jgi:3-phenylpropionate/trans-cinnamate dioxygenase ferredoxin subunit